MDRENETRLITALEKLATALTKAIENQAHPPIAFNVGIVRGEWHQGIFHHCRDCDRPKVCALIKQATQPCWSPSVQDVNKHTMGL